MATSSPTRRGIATFDQMFEGIRTALKSNVQQSILFAEKNLDNDLAKRVLKALFLVKYVKPFKATRRNVAILILDRFDADLTEHKRRVEDALAVLEQNTYIQRNGELFEFLTDEEKDVEQEIKASGVDNDEIAKVLEELIFDGVIKARKLRHEGSSHDYSYARYLDDKPRGKDYELAINLVTPFHDQNGNVDAVKLRTLSKDEMTVVLKSDDRFVKDLMMYKKTEKYVRQSNLGGLAPSLARIIQAKGEQNRDRYRDLTQKARALVADARLIVRGEEIEIRSEDLQDRIASGFQKLIDKVYPYLGMLRGIVYTEDDIARHLAKGKDGMFGEGGTRLTEPEQEVLNFARANGSKGVRTTAQAIIGYFEKKPYGWPYAAILCTTASLIARGKIEARLDGSPLEGAALEKALRSNREQGKVVFELQLEFTPVQVRTLKKSYQELFDTQPAESEGKALGLETAAAFGSLNSEIGERLAEVSRYPFLAALKPVQDALREVGGKAYAWYLTDLGQHKERLLDLKEDVLDPIRRFMAGAQKRIYDDARAFLAKQAANFVYGGEDRADAIRAVLDDPRCFNGNSIQQVKGKLDALRTEINAVVAAERKAALADMEGMRAKLRALPEYASLGEANRAEIDAAFARVLQTIGGSDLIAMIRERASSFKSSTYPALLGRVTAPRAKPDAAAEAIAKVAAGGATTHPGMEEGAAPPPVPPVAPEYVPAATLRVTFDKAYLADEEDVATYLEKLRSALMAEIRAGKRVTV